MNSPIDPGNSTTLASYDAVAHEYYDRRRHPTCHNFRQASILYLRKRLRAPALRGQRVLEIGAGRSLAAPLLRQCRLPLTALSLVDRSAGMLSHSKRWKRLGAVLFVGDARHVPSADGAFGLVVASLGDPYNVPQFWKEAERVLAADGRLLFTCPSYEWASRFRNHNNPAALHQAEFMLRNGEIVQTPSFVLPLPEQEEMTANAKLRMVDFDTVRLDEIHGPLSPKLSVVNADRAPFLWGFELTKPARDPSD